MAPGPTQKYAFRKMTVVSAGAFVVVALLITVSSLFVMPRLLGRRPPAPADWMQTGAEVFLILLVGSLAVHLMSRLEMERKEAEKALRDSEEKLRLMFDSVTDGIMVIDRAGYITQVNEASVRLYGYDSREQLIGHSVADLVSEQDRVRARRDRARTLERGHIKNVEYSLLTRDGRQFDAEVNAAVLRNGSSRPIGFIAIVEDIAERRRMEEQLIVTDRLASIGELAAGIAHELNNPLTSVIGFAQLLLAKEVPPDVKEDLSIVYSEAQRSAEVVKNLLAFARRDRPAKQQVNINSIIMKLLELRTYEQRVNNIRVDTQLAPDLPEVMADYFQMQQVFLNIIINAEYFMHEARGRGTLTIITGRMDSLVRVIIGDDGPGIPPENMGHIFDPFFTTKDVGKGTGLGLSICHGIVAAHGGRVYAESEPAKGATFIVELPIAAN